MGALRRGHLILVAVAVALAVGGVVLFGGGPAELVFGVALLVPLLLAVGHAFLAAVQAHRESESARRLVRTDPERLAHDAVAAERTRLSLDVQSSVRGNVEQMRALAREAALRWDEDPRPALEAIQECGRHAMTDLRRLLGLLRAASPDPEEEAVAAPSRVVPSPDRRIRRADVVLAAVAVLLALVESQAYRTWSEELATTGLGVVITGLVAATVLGRTMAPGAGAVIAAALIAAGTATGHPTLGGLWIILTIGGLAWACGAGERHLAWAFLGPSALVVALVHKHQRYEPENLAITLIILGVGLVSGLLARGARRRADRARSAARARSAELESLTHEALLAERRTVARDLHDVVSGSIGVIVMQAGAAQALLGSEPGRARHALDVVLDTCDRALVELAQLLTELDSSGVGGGTTERGAHDVLELVDRMRSAGLEIRLAMDLGDDVTRSTSSAVGYRVVQESLTNVLRHAPNSHVQVALQREAGVLHVSVVDDGPGPTGQDLRGYGLVGLAERVQQAGGTLHVGAGPTGGFGVSARIPAPEHQRADGDRAATGSPAATAPGPEGPA